MEDLKKIRLFDGVELESIKGLIDACTIRVLASEEVLLRPGEVNQTVYFLLNGHVRIHLESLRSDPVAVLGPGESVGEMSVIDHQPTSAFVVAGQACRLLVMDEDVLWSLVHFSHAAACNLLVSLTARLRHADALIAGGLEEDREFRRYGTVDALTGLHNRFWLENALDRQIQRVTTDGRPLSVIMLDIDFFKTFNDRYGHAYGDHVLYSVAHAIGGHLRPSEIVARYGGDEFVVLLPEVGVEAARLIGERLQNAVMEAVPVMPDGKPIPHPTISLGLATLKPGQKADSLIADADQALYRAKSKGRNCISE